MTTLDDEKLNQARTMIECDRVTPPTPGRPPIRPLPLSTPPASPVKESSLASENARRKRRSGEDGTSRGTSLPPCIKPPGAVGTAGNSSCASDPRDDRRVSFAPPPDEVRRRVRLAELRAKGFRPDYALGDLCRRREHMVVERTREDALRSVVGMKLKVGPA